MANSNYGDARGFFEEHEHEYDTEVRAVRRLGTGALLHLGTLVPLAVASLLAVVPIGAIVLTTLGRVALIALVVVWWLPLPFLSIRPTASLLARGKGYREPIADETVRLAGPWGDLLRRASLPQRRYLLMVRDGEQVGLEPCDGFTSGFPAGCHVVVVPATAVARLQPQELEAVLAHSLGHQLGMHSVTRLLAFELWVPLLLVQLGLNLAWFVVCLGYDVIALGSRIAHAIFPPLTLAFWALLIFCAFFVAGAVLFVVPWLAAMIVLYLAAVGLGRLTRYAQEYEADATAVGLGLGRPLLAVLESALRCPLPSQPRYERLLKIRPLPVRRTDRMRATLTRAGG
jgi:Zn-dependent protease with chaperone function